MYFCLNELKYTNESKNFELETFFISKKKRVDWTSTLKYMYFCKSIPNIILALVNNKKKRNI